MEARPATPTDHIPNSASLGVGYRRSWDGI